VKDESFPGSTSARAILRRGHFRRVYTRNPSDETLVENAIKAGDLVPLSEQTDLSPAYFLTECEFRRNPATDSELKPAGVPI
ncbi:MAG TPA: hypothetical protein VGP23_09650, partial [Candidatus Binataceae bacterium]|nr:hypothetical protein [Candidatus Binataceae bacterium]